MLRMLSALAAVAVALVAISAASAGSRAGRLVGTVGPGFTITLKENGALVKTLKAGTYTLVVHDLASIHGYSLDGPNGFAKDFTTPAFVGTKTVTLVLKAGKYKYYCPPHEPSMFGHFTVTG